MIKDLLLKWDEDCSPDDYKEIFMTSCITTGICMVALCIGITIFLRWLGISDWLIKHNLVRGLTFIIMGTITAIFARTYGGKGMTEESNRFVLKFMYIPIILTMTMLQNVVWAVFIFVSIITFLTFSLKGEMIDKWYWTMAKYIPYFATTIYLLISIYLIGFDKYNFFDFVFGAVISFLFPKAFLNVVKCAYYVAERKCDDTLILYLKKHPISSGYLNAELYFLYCFLNIGELMQEFDSENSKD